MWALGYQWDVGDAHDWQCQKRRRNGVRCKGHTVDRFTPVCRTHLEPEIEEVAGVVEAAYRAGVVAGQERTRSAVAMQRHWDAWVAGSSLATVVVSDEDTSVDIEPDLAGPVGEGIQEPLFD